MYTFIAGDADRHGAGTAWDFWSRRCKRRMHVPTGAAFTYGLSLEFDATVAKFVEQPVPEVEEGKKPHWPARLFWFYVERLNGRRELHCTQDPAAADDPATRRLAGKLRESGIRFVVVEDKPPSEERVRNLVRLQALVGDCDGAATVCAQQLKKAGKPGSSHSINRLIEDAAKAGSVGHVAARAVGLLLHEGALTGALDEDVLSGQTVLTWS